MESVCTETMKPLHKRLLDYIVDHNWTIDTVIEYSTHAGKVWAIHEWCNTTAIPLVLFYVNNNVNDKDELVATLIHEASKPDNKNHRLTTFHNETLKSMLYMKSVEEISLILAAYGY